MCSAPNPNPTPISARIAVIATGLGWEDKSYYGDTDYGLLQTFANDNYRVQVSYVPDGRHGAGNDINSVNVVNQAGQVLLDLEEDNQPKMRAELLYALNAYLEE